MPWTVDSAPSATKNLSPRKLKVWVKVANKCLDGGDDKETAIKKAFGAANRISETAQEFGKRLWTSLLEAGGDPADLHAKKAKTMMGNIEKILPELKGRGKNETTSGSDLTRVDYPFPGGSLHIQFSKLAKLTKLKYNVLLFKDGIEFYDRL